MNQGYRFGPPLLGIIVIISVAFLFGIAASVDAFFVLRIDDRAIDAKPALVALDSGLGIAVSLLETEFGFEVNDVDLPVIGLRYGERQAVVVVGDRNAVIDGKQTALIAAPRLEDGVPFVPLTLVTQLARLRIENDLLTGVMTLRTSSGGRAAAGATGSSQPDPQRNTQPDPQLDQGADQQQSRPLEVEVRDQQLDPRPDSQRDLPAGEAPDPGMVGRSAAFDSGTLIDLEGEVGHWPGSAAEARDTGLSSSTADPKEADPTTQTSVLDSLLEKILALGRPDPNRDAEGSAEDRVGGPVWYQVGDRAGVLNADPGLGFAPGVIPAVIEDIQLVHHNGYVRIEVFADRDVEPRVMFLGEPARLVIDIDEAVSATGWSVAAGDGRIVQQLRVNGAESGGVRIVADLTAPTGYTVTRADDGMGFVLHLNHQLQLVEAMPADGGGVSLQMFVSGPVPYRAFPLREPNRVVIDLFGVSVPGAQEVLLPGGWAATFRLSQFEQTAVRGVFVLRDGAEGLAQAEEGILRPGGDGLVQLLFDNGGLTARASNPGQSAANALQFVGYGRSDDLEYILIHAEQPLDVDVLRLRGPDRIVLDVPALEVGRSLSLSPQDSSVVKAVRAGQAVDAAGRIVAETVGVSEHLLLLSPDRTRALLGLRPSGLAGRTIVVDAGHGGKDPGAIGFSGTFEKDVTLAVALQLADLLRRAGANVVLTRDRDVELTLSDRAQTANLIGADAFVSIHADAVGFGIVASGTSTFYHPENGSGSETSINRRYALTLQGELLSTLGLPDRGVHERAFHVVLNTKMPAALVEVGFIDNPEEERLLLDPAFQARAAAGVADGIVRFFGEQAAEAPEHTQAWRARMEQVAGAWLRLGILPSGVAALEPTPLLAVAQRDNRLRPELDFDMGFPEL